MRRGCMFGRVCEVRNEVITMIHEADCEEVREIKDCLVVYIKYTIEKNVQMKQKEIKEKETDENRNRKNNQQRKSFWRELISMRLR